MFLGLFLRRTPDNCTHDRSSRNALVMCMSDLYFGGSCVWCRVTGVSGEETKPWYPLVLR